MECPVNADFFETKGHRQGGDERPQTCEEEEQIARAGNGTYPLIPDVYRI
jgi:hypothetical protein